MKVLISLKDLKAGKGKQTQSSNVKTVYNKASKGLSINLKVGVGKCKKCYIVYV